MENRKLKEENITDFRAYLVREEKSAATVEKYLRDTREFLAFAGEREVTKELVMAWKETLAAECAARTVNGKLASLNSLLQFLEWGDCRVKSLKIQQQAYASEDQELTLEEYRRLLAAADGQPQLRLMMEAIAGTGIRVSELRYFTVEAVQAGEIRIRNKGKNRAILLPDNLKKKLRAWVKEQGISGGAIFRSRNGNPLSRSSVWLRMKKLYRAAGVAAGKVFPHNLRKLFARRFYEVKGDIAKLADVLGHSNINTTRIYIMTTGVEHRRILNQLGLVVYRDKKILQNIHSVAKKESIAGQIKLYICPHSTMPRFKMQEEFTGNRKKFRKGGVLLHHTRHPLIFAQHKGTLKPFFSKKAGVCGFVRPNFRIPGRAPPFFIRQPALPRRPNATEWIFCPVPHPYGGKSCYGEQNCGFAAWVIPVSF